MSDTPRMDLVAGSEYELETARQIERELAAVTAERDALWGALRWLCWDDCSPCATAIRDCPRYLDAIESDTVTPQP